MPNDKNIAFRLPQPYYGQLEKLAKETDAESINIMARNLVIMFLDQQQLLREVCSEVSDTRADIDELRRCLARSVEAILTNLRTDLSEQEIKNWVFEKLWPKPSEGS